MISLSAMTPDLWVLAVATVICAAVFAVAAISAVDAPAPGSRPAARHRRRLSRSELVMEAREVFYTAGYAALGVYLLGAAAFAPLVRLLHRLDGWRVRRFWGGKAVHS